MDCAQASYRHPDIQGHQLGVLQQALENMISGARCTTSTRDWKRYLQGFLYDPGMGFAWFVYRLLLLPHGFFSVVCELFRVVAGLNAACLLFHGRFSRCVHAFAVVIVSGFVYGV